MNLSDVLWLLQGQVGCQRLLSASEGSPPSDGVCLGLSEHEHSLVEGSLTQPLTAPHSPTQSHTPHSFACVNACLCVYVYILLISVSGICILSGLVLLGTFFTALDLKGIF